MTDELEERRREDKELAATLARLDERWKTVTERLDRIDEKLTIAEDLRVQMAALEARSRITYTLLGLIVSGLLGLAFKVLGG